MQGKSENGPGGKIDPVVLKEGTDLAVENPVVSGEKENKTTRGEPEEGVIGKDNEQEDSHASSKSSSAEALRESVDRHCVKVISFGDGIKKEKENNPDFDYQKALRETDEIVGETIDMALNSEGLSEDDSNNLGVCLESLEKLKSELEEFLDSKQTEKEELEKQRILKEINDSKAQEIDSKAPEEDKLEKRKMRPSFKAAENAVAKIEELYTYKNILDEGGELSDAQKEQWEKHLPGKEITKEAAQEEIERRFSGAGLAAGVSGFGGEVDEMRKSMERGGAAKKFEGVADRMLTNIRIVKESIEIERQKVKADMEPEKLRLYEEQLAIVDKFAKESANEFKSTQLESVDTVSTVAYNLRGLDLALIREKDTAYRPLMEKLLEMAGKENYFEEIKRADNRSRCKHSKKELEHGRYEFSIKWQDLAGEKSGEEKKLKIVVDLGGNLSEKKQAGKKDQAGFWSGHLWDRGKNRRVLVNGEEFRSREEGEGGEIIAEGASSSISGGREGLESEEIEEENNDINKIEIDERIKEEYPKTAEFFEYMIEKMNEEEAVSSKANIEDLLGQKKERKLKDWIAKTLEEIESKQSPIERGLNKEDLERFSSLGKAALGELEDKVASRLNDEELENKIEPEVNSETVESEEPNKMGEEDVVTERVFLKAIGNKKDVKPVGFKPEQKGKAEKKKEEKPSTLEKYVENLKISEIEDGDIVMIKSKNSDSFILERSSEDGKVYITRDLYPTLKGYFGANSEGKKFPMEEDASLDKGTTGDRVVPLIISKIEEIKIRKTQEKQ